MALIVTVCLSNELLTFLFLRHAGIEEALFYQKNYRWNRSTGNTAGGVFQCNINVLINTFISVDENNVCV